MNEKCRKCGASAATRVKVCKICGYHTLKARLSKALVALLKVFLVLLVLGGAYYYIGWIHGTVVIESEFGTARFGARFGDEVYLMGLADCGHFRVMIAGSSTSLELYGHNLTDNELRQIGGMSRLENLNISNTQVVDIAHLANLTNLRILAISWNNISDISPLANLTNLEVLAMSGTMVSDISPLASLTNLERLDIQSNLISDLSPLANLANLRYLFIENNTVIDISPLAHLSNLCLLSMEDNFVNDISPLAYLPRLCSLRLTRNPVKDFSTIANLTNLWSISFTISPATNLASFPALPNLSNVQIGEAVITNNFTVLSRLPNLTGLTIYNSAIQDFCFLHELDLRYLSIGMSELSDLAPLVEAISGFTHLQHLRLPNNQISDLTPLAQLCSRTNLCLFGNSLITDWSPVEHLRSVRGRPSR